MNPVNVKSKSPTTRTSSSAIFCATANPTEVILAESKLGRGILGVVDGFSPKGIEDDDGIKWRKDFLRQIGYKQ